MLRRPAIRVVRPVFTLILVLPFLSPPAWAGPFDGQVLIPEEVECSRQQLGEIMRRSWVTLPNDPGLQRPWGLAVSYIGQSGQMVVNAYMHQYDVIGPSGERDLPERHLWMVLDPEQTGFLSNPERPLLPKALIARDLNASAIVRPTDIGYLEYRLNPLKLDPKTTPPAELYDPETPGIKVVNNLYELAADKSEAKPGLGRGLLEALEPCPQFTEGKIDEYDIHVMQLLAKIFKGSTPNGPRHPVSQIIYRAEGDPKNLSEGIRTFVVDIYPRNPETFGFEDSGGQPYGMIQVNVKIQFDTDSRIMSLPPPKPNQRTALRIDTSLPRPELWVAGYVHRPTKLPTLVVDSSTGAVIPLEGATYKYGSAHGSYGVGRAPGTAGNPAEVLEGGINWNSTLPPPHPWRKPR